MPNDIQAQTADGVIHSFPAGTAPEVVDGAIKKYTSQQAIKTANSQPTQFEQDRQGSGGFLSNVGQYASALAPSLRRMALNMNPITGPPLLAYDAIKTAIGAPGRASREFNADKGMGLGTQALGATGAALAPLAGVNPDAVRQVANTGDTEGVYGQLALPTIGAAAGLSGTLGINDAVSDAASNAANNVKGRFSIDPNYHIPGTPIKFRLGAAPPPEAPPNVQSLNESPYFPQIQAARTLARRQALSDMSPSVAAPEVDPVAAAVKNRTAAYIPTRMPSVPDVPTQIDPLAQAVKNRTAAYLPTRMPTQPEPTPQVDPLAQAVKNRTATYLPTRMPAPPEVPEAIDPLASAVKNRTAAYLPTRMPARTPVGAVTAPLAPEYSLSSGVRDTPFTLPAPSAEASSGTGGSVQYVKSLGAPGARSVTSGETATPSDSLDEQTFIVPEPNDFAPGEPNNMGSIPRSELPDLAQRLKAGAGSQLKSLGKTVLYLPRGSSR